MGHNSGNESDCHSVGYPSCKRAGLFLRNEPLDPSLTCCPARGLCPPASSQNGTGGGGYVFAVEDNYCLFAWMPFYFFLPLTIPLLFYSELCEVFSRSYLVSTLQEDGGKGLLSML